MTSIWQAIKDRLNPSEIYEVANIIGNDLIDRNEAAYIEIASLSDILTTLQANNDRLENSLSIKTQLSEIPLREMLKTKISRLLTQIAFSPSGMNEKNVVDYVSKTAPSRSQPNSGKRPSSAQSIATDVSLEPVAIYINVFDIDRVVDVIRDALNDEYAQIMNEIDQINSSFESESAFAKEIRNASNLSPPSTAELKSLETKLTKTIELDRVLNTESKKLPPLPLRQSSIPREKASVKLKQKAANKIKADVKQTQRAAKPPRDYLYKI